MRNTIAGIALGALMVTLPVYMARGQANGTTQVKTAKVAQGKQVSMDLTVDKAANIDANIYLDVSFETSPSEPQLPQLTGRLPMGQTKCTVAANVPVDAKIGRWAISRIMFAPLQGGGQTQLTKHGDLSFEVVAGEKIISPDSATISDIR
jgi:hypothetical protein